MEGVNMENQQYSTNAESAAPKAPASSLASSVLRNIFGQIKLAGSVQPRKSLTDSFEADPQTTSEIPEAEPFAQNSSAGELARNALCRLDQRKERAAVELGIDVSDVESLPFDLSTLESEGIFMNIDCRGFGGLVRQLEWKTLGVNLPKDTAVRVSPPRAGLLPDLYRNKLMRGAAQAHNALAKFGFRFTLCETVWGTSDYKWIPWTAFEQFEQAYFRACETLSVAKAEILENYEEIVVVLSDSFRDLAKDSADRLQATTSEPFNTEQFIEAVVAQALSMVPTPDMIRDELVITMKPKVIVLGSEMIAERNLARTLALETAKVDAKRTTLELEINSRQRIEKLKVDEVAAELRREREVKERIRNMKIDAARREAEEAVSPVKEGFAQITAKIFEAATEMAERMKDAKFVPGSLAKRARQMCEWYQLMNFTGDTSLEEVLDQLEISAGREIKLRSPDEMRTALSDVLRATSMQSRKLLDEGRLFALEL